jgi:hypothetical protein
MYEGNSSTDNCACMKEIVAFFSQPEMLPVHVVFVSSSLLVLALSPPHRLCLLLLCMPVLSGILQYRRRELNKSRRNLEHKGSVSSSFTLVRALVLALVLQVPVLDLVLLQQALFSGLLHPTPTRLHSVLRRGQRWQGKGPSDLEVRFRRMPWNLAPRSPEMTRLPPLPLLLRVRGVKLRSSSSSSNNNSRELHPRMGRKLACLEAVCHGCSKMIRRASGDFAIKSCWLSPRHVEAQRGMS